MRGGEIVQLHVGGCGNRVGYEYWKRVATEHGLDSNLQAVEQDPFDEPRAAHRAVSFEESGDGRFEPRCVCSDMDVCDIEFMKYGGGSKRTGLEAGMASQSAWGDSGLNGNWARGFYEMGADLASSMVDCMRRRLRACDCAEVVNLCAGVAGGMGGGAGSKVTQSIVEELGSRMSASVVLPSTDSLQDGHAGATRAYNTILSLQYLHEHTEVLVFHEDNQFTFDDRLEQFSRGVGAFTAPMRFQTPHTLDSLLADLHVDTKAKICSFSIEPSKSPVAACPAAACTFGTLSVLHEGADVALADAVASQCNWPRDRLMESECLHALAAAASRQASLAMFTQHVLQRVAAYTRIRTPLYRVFSTDIPEPASTQSVSVVSHDTNVIAVMDRQLNRFKEGVKTRQMLHWYTGEGMDMMEFEHAQVVVEEYVSDYRDKLARHI